MKIDLAFPLKEYGLGIDFTHDRYVIGHVENRDHVFLTVQQAAKALLTLTPEEIALLLEGVSTRQQYYLDQAVFRVIQQAACSPLDEREFHETRARLQSLCRDFSFLNGGLDQVIARLRFAREEAVEEVETALAPSREPE